MWLGCLLPPRPASFLPLHTRAPPWGLSLTRRRDASLFPKEPLGPAWVKGQPWSFGRAAARPGKEGKQHRGSFLSFAEYLREPALLTLQRGHHSCGKQLPRSEQTALK